MRRFTFVAAAVFFITMGGVLAVESMAGCVYTSDSNIVQSSGNDVTTYGDSACPRKAAAPAPVVAPKVMGQAVKPTPAPMPERAPAPAPAPVEKSIMETITLDVTFDTAKSTVKPGSYPEIEKFASYLKSFPNVKAEIQGHTDNTGTAAANVTLSQNRANAVMDLLITKYNIDASRLSAKGYGQEKPIATNATAAGRAQNRRVEAVIMK